MGTLFIVLVLFIGGGEIIEGLNKAGPGLNTFTIIIFIFWGTGLAGLVLAWWKEGPGGLISVVSFIVFNILAAVNPTPGSRWTFVLLIFLFPSILFLFYWWLKKKSSEKFSKD